MTSAEIELGMTSHPFAATPPSAQIFLTVFSFTADSSLEWISCNKSKLRVLKRAVSA
jgi:hypothetical protein